MQVPTHQPAHHTTAAKGVATTQNQSHPEDSIPSKDKVASNPFRQLILPGTTSRVFAESEVSPIAAQKTITCKWQHAALPIQLSVATDDQPATDHIKAQSQLTH